MAYRDDLTAARERVANLERELSEERERRREVEASLEQAREGRARTELARSSPPPGPEPAALATSPRRLGNIHYNPPRSWFPLLWVYLALLRLAWAKVPNASAPASDRVITLALHYLVVVPFVYGVWLPLYVLSMAIMLPWTALVSLAASVVMLPIVFSSRFRFSSAPPTDEEGWFHGDASPESGSVLFCIVCTLTVPLSLLLIVCHPLIADDA